MTTSPAILWFRNDLRLADHAALHAAIETGRPILPLYILDDDAAAPWAAGGASRWWLHHSLASLAKSLSAIGSGLILRRGDSVAILADIVKHTNAQEVFTGGSAEPWARQLDRAVAASLGQMGLTFHRMRTMMLFNPDQVRTKAGGTFSVYTPFSNACLALEGSRPPLPAPDKLATPKMPTSDALHAWGLLPTQPDWAHGLRQTWTPGETGAAARMRLFLDQALDVYADQRDYPGVAGTSMLSPHLHFGEISATQLWHQAWRMPNSKSREKFIRELLWREFSIHLLWHHPTLPDQPLRQEFAMMPWRDDPASLRAWRQGRTGVPIVDAGMRQLWQTGWMHNRVRMIVASFLVKHLMIPWQTGAAWFWDTLVDADLANNSASWQWVAGCGADAAPYFRVFNPVLQGKKFDAQGDYVRHFVPELAQLDPQHIHAPWEADPTTLSAAGVMLGQTYPMPIVDLAAGRARALEAYAGLRAVA
jgi:deoxyribodipyrimidine photo-lyase